MKYLAPFMREVSGSVGQRLSMMEIKACFTSPGRPALVVMKESSEKPTLDEEETKFIKFLNKHIKPVSPEDVSKEIELPLRETLAQGLILKERGLLFFKPIKPYEKFAGENIGFLITPEGREIVKKL